MSTMTWKTSSPWPESLQEDHRFRWILLQTLTVCFLLAVVTSNVRIPLPDIDIEEELPPRHVQLLVPKPRTVNLPSQPVPTEVTTSPKPRAEPEKPPVVVPPETPRQKAARSGVLAMGDALGELRASTPKTGTTLARGNAVAEVNSDLQQPSTLSASVNKGSGGIQGDIAHQSVLGEAALPERQGTGMEGRGRVASATTGDQLSSGPPGVARSHDEIQELLDRNKGAMYTLYNRELRVDASLQGKLVMSITIAPAGNVTRCIIISSDLGSASLERQLIALVSSIDFGNLPGVAEVTTRIPVEFFPR